MEQETGQRVWVPTFPSLQVQMTGLVAH